MKLMRDLTIHRCGNKTCNQVARWTDGSRWYCKTHAPYGFEYVMPPAPPAREGVLVSSTRLIVRYKQ